MVSVVNPKVNVIDYGPKITNSDGNVIVTPDEIVWGAAGVTYNDMDAIDELRRLKSKEVDIHETVRKSLIRSGGAGHASMATTPGLWMILEGDCSKMVDSMFTGARFASSLMPSGRRVPVEKEAIIIPKSINANSQARALYLETSEKNIGLYESLQTRGVSKQEASKIVQYGHKGGGVMFMPLETVVHYAREFEVNTDAIPAEGLEIISQLVDFVKSHGMEITYEARKAAPRTSSVNPSIFHKEVNEAGILKKGIVQPKILTHSSYIETNPERDERIDQWLDQRKEIFEHPERIQTEWPELLADLEQIVNDFNNTVSIKTISNSPWRVWGEVKRHRTLPQTVESVYLAAEAALNIPEEGDYLKVVSIPPSVSKDPNNLKDWIERFSDSMKTYNRLIKLGIPESDAISVVPRGLKLGITKTFDLYNLTTGYMSLRLCNTAEPEMRQTTEEERNLILRGEEDHPVSKLIMPKCGYTGFCPDKNCGKVQKYVAEYTPEFHKKLLESRKAEIENRL